MAKKPEHAPEPVSDEEVSKVVQGGTRFYAFAGPFNYVRPKGGKVSFKDNPFTVTDPDMIRELQYYVDKGQLQKQES